MKKLEYNLKTMYKTNSIVEASILSAVAVVMAIVAIYIPVLGAFINFVWPLPIIICGVRNGLKWSILTTLIAGLLCAMLINPLQAFLLVAVFGILGIILGEGMRRNTKPFNILLLGSCGALLALIINFAIAFLIMNINPIEMLFESFDSSLIQMAEFQRSHGINETEIAVSIASYKKLIQMMRVIMPGALLLTAPSLAFINYWTAKKILTKLGNQFEDLPPFRNWVIPKWLILPYGLSLVAVGYCFQYAPNSWYYQVAVNIQMMCSAIFMLQGLSLIYWYVHKKNKPTWWAHLATCLVFIQIFSFILLWVGAFDCIADFRKIRGKNL